MVYDQELHRRQYHGLYGEQERHPTEHTQEDWALNTLSFNFPIKFYPGQSREDISPGIIRIKRDYSACLFHDCFTAVHDIYTSRGRAESELVVPMRTSLTRMIFH